MLPKSSLSPAARWIWTEAVVPNSMIACRGTLALPAAPRRATLHIFADTKYKVYINGRFVGAGPAPFRKPVIQVDACDAAPFLQAGPNTVLIVAHFIGCNVKYNTAEQPGVIAALDAHLPGGRRTQTVTGDTWQVVDLLCWNRQTPRRNWAIEHIEDVDLAHPAFRILTRDAAEDYSDGGRRTPAARWRRPRVFARPDLELRTRQVPPLRWTREDLTRPAAIFRTNTEIYNLQDTAIRLDHEHIRPEWDERVHELTRGGTLRFDRREGEPGVALLYDFGRVCAGEPAAEIVCERPCTLEFALAENLRADGHPIVWRNGSLYYARYHLTAGVNRVRFYHFNGHRYLYFVFKDAVGAVEVRRVTTHHCRADLEFTDTLACDDRVAESVYRISRRSLALNTQANAYDCNTREQGTYWGDGVWIVDSVGHQTGNFAHLRHMAYAMTDEYRACGPMLPGSLYGIGQPLYEYGLVPVEVLRRYHRYTGDLKAVRDNLDTARAIVALYRTFKEAHGLLTVNAIKTGDERYRAGLLFLDHPGNGWHPQTTTGMDRRDPNAGFNLFYLQALQGLAELERACGLRATRDPEIAAVAAAIRDTCHIAERGLIADAAPAAGHPPRFSQLVNALAITTGLLQGDAARHALATVLDVPRHPWVSQGTPYSYFFLADAAARTGQVDLAMRAFCRDFTPMLARGATTTWEAWNAENHDSLNHAWSAPLPLLVRTGVMGLSPLKPGYAVAGLKPRLDVFDQFEGTCCIPQGEVTMRWTRVRPDAWDLAVSLPAGVAGVLRLPKGLRRFTGRWQGRVMGQR
jgi:hypothetical protein